MSHLYLNRKFLQDPVTQGSSVTNHSRRNVAAGSRGKLYIFGGNKDGSVAAWLQLCRSDLGGGFKYLLFSPILGEMIQFD